MGKKEGEENLLDGEKLDFFGSEHGLDSKLKIGGILNLIADTTHNFTDGMAIAASFLTSYHVGFSTTLAVLVHEIPHEIGDYAILIQSGFSRKSAMAAQLITAIGAFLGVFVGIIGGGTSTGTWWILPFTAGGFIYIATVDVIPSLLEDTTAKQTLAEVCAMLTGIFLMVLIAMYE